MCMRAKIFILWLLSLVLTCSGCRNPMDQQRAAVMTPVLAKGVTTQTPTPKMATATPPPVPMLSFSPAEKEQLIDQILTQEYQCKLPCFAGITPGVTLWSDARSFLEQVSEKIYPSGTSSTYSIEIQQGSVVDFYIPRDKVEFIMAPRKQYPVDELLHAYGEPDEIYIYILDALPVDSTVSYIVHLFYKMGLAVQYYGEAAKGPVVSVCFTEKDGESIDAFFWLWDGDLKISFEDVYRDYVSKFYQPEVSLGYYQLADLSDLTVHEFYETYRNQSKGGCLELKNPHFAQ